MPEPTYQCCYTNTQKDVGGTISSGWQAVEVSPEIPTKVYEACVKRQNVNSSLCASAVDEDGNVLTQYELFGDGGHLYVIRSQYGLSDRLGRPNMFSHAIIFPLRGDDILLNPNYYVSLDPASFKHEENQQSWSGVCYRPTSLSLKMAMDYAGLDREKYAVLARCIYAQMNATKGTDPLYIQYDGTEQQLRGIMYCIGAGIPHFMLKTIHVASCPTANDSGKHVVFSKNAKAKGRWLVPQTGENSVLNQRLERKINRCGYVDYAILHDQIPWFFVNLNNIATTIAGASGVNGQTSKLAFYLLAYADESNRIDRSKFTDEELESDFSDALRLSQGNSFAEKLLAWTLEEINRRNIRLTAENEALLDTWLSSAKSEDLQAAGRAYKTK